jgi:ubiquitin-protein ligase E3 A
MNKENLTLFRSDDLAQLLCGSGDLDFSNLEFSPNLTYSDGFSRQSPTIQFFWRLVKEGFTEEQKKQLLLFATGSDRAPVGGLGKMEFAIVKNGVFNAENQRLPTAHTCFNSLLLPEYSTYEECKDQLLKAITNPTGFGLR